MSSQAASQSDPDSAEESAIEGETDPYDGGFRFTDEHLTRHRVESGYSRRYVDTIKVDKDGVRMHHDYDGSHPFDNEIRCDCGKTFNTDKEAKIHLERVRRRHRHRIPPLPRLPSTISWADEKSTALDGRVTINPDDFNVLGKVIEGLDIVEAESVATLTPPSNYTFDTWGPLQDGGEFTDDGDITFASKYLGQALAFLTDRTHCYDPDAYQILSRGPRQAACVTDGDTGILVAPRR